MGLDNFKTPKSVWMDELEDRAQNRGLSLHYFHVAANSHYFKIEGTETRAIGKTHHTKESNRDGHYINLNSVEEANWKANPEDIPSPIRTDSELVDIFGIVIDHRNSNDHQSDRDDFLVLTEEILDDEIPESGKKEFRITSSGYRHPFGQHKNSWERIFMNVE